MISTRLLAAVALCFAGLQCTSARVVAADTPAAGALPDPYTQAVNEYVGAARAEISAVKKEVEDNEKAKRGKTFAGVKEAAERCEKLIDQLKATGPGRFDVVKADYERARTELLERLADARNR